MVRFSTDVLRDYIKEAVTAEADGIILCDPTASVSLVSKDDFVEFSKPYITELGEMVTGAGKHLLVYICGDTGDRLEDVVDMGADIFSIDHQVDVGHVMDCIGDRQPILGNVDPATTLYRGSVEDVRRESLACINMARGRPLIPGAGCDISPGTPLANVQAWMGAVPQ